MKRLLLIAAVVCAPFAASAGTSIHGIIDHHILPRFERLAAASDTLSEAAMHDCNPASARLRQAFGAAFDAWVSASHLRFGPTEVEDRAFALAFWPDSRGATPRSLARLIATADPIVDTPEAYLQVSIAARGFYAMELMLFDEALMRAGDEEYHCRLMQTLSADIAATSMAIYDDWLNRYVGVMGAPGPDGTYRSREEVLQEMLRALSTGLQFTHDSRLGRPLGTFERPRPNRAEARRSGRSSRHVMLSLQSLRDLAALLAAEDPALATELDTQFDAALARLAALKDPVFAGINTPQGRLKVEVVQQAIQDIRTSVQTKLGPKLGVGAGFNSLDGD